MLLQKSLPPPPPLQTPTSTFILFHITMPVEVRECRPDWSQGHCHTLITGQSRGINAQPLGLHHDRCHTNYSHISMAIRQTVKGAQAVVVRGGGKTEEMPEAETQCWALLAGVVGWESGFKLLRSKRVCAKEMEAERLVPIRFERERVNRGEWVEAQQVGPCVCVCVARTQTPHFYCIFSFPDITQAIPACCHGHFTKWI